MTTQIELRPLVDVVPPAAVVGALPERQRIASSAGCDRTVTFDIGASKSAGMALVT